MFAKPAPRPDHPGELLKIRIPVTKTMMPEEGMEVDATDLFWARRLRAGDVVEAPPPVPATADRSADE